MSRREIDAARWDAAVNLSAVPLVYAQSWYLDIVSNGQWAAVVLDDYRALMPLPYHRKYFGVPRIFQPLLCQQLGVFSVEPLSENAFNMMLSTVPFYMGKLALSFHEHSQFVPQGKQPVPNFVLRLNHPYEQLFSAYSANHRRNIRKARCRDDWQLMDVIDIQVFLNAIKRYHIERGNRIPTSLYGIAALLIKDALARQSAIVRSLYIDDELIAAIFYLKHEGRLINLLNYTSRKGRELSAMHYLSDCVIAEFADTDTLMDFEGSSIPELARFYEGFGAENHIFWR